VNFAAAVMAAMAMSPFGLYHHATATDLEKPAFRHELASSFSLVTVRGDGGSVAGGVGEFLHNRGNAAVFLYRRGTAVSDDDAATLARDHPDWLAHDQAGNVVTSNAGGDVIDVTKPAVREWLVAGIERDVRAGQYDGVYLDVLGAFFSARFYSARPVINGTPLADTAWRDGSVALINAVKAATGKPVIANGFGLQNGNNYLDHKADADQLIAAADGIQIEQFVRNGNQALDRYKPTARWRADIDFLSVVGRLGKIVLADTRVRAGADKVAVGRQGEYALASFLIGAEGPARFRFAVGAATGTVDESASTTIAELGLPKGRAKEANGAFTRLFANGEVNVNPATHDARIVVAKRTVTTAPPRRENTVRFYAIGLVAAALLAGGLGYAAVRSRR
jgi:hypothetical protein